VSPKYKIGDLVILNDFGRLVIDDNRTRVGIVVNGPDNKLHPSPEEATLMYWAYDIMVADELITEVPQEFLQRMIDADHEENPTLSRE